MIRRICSLVLERTAVTGGGLVALVYLLGLISEIGFRHGSPWDVLLSFPLALASLLLVGWTLYCFHAFSRRWQWRVLGFAVLFCWVFVTFLTDPTLSCTGFGNRIFATVNKMATVLFTKRSGIESGYSSLRKINYMSIQISMAVYLGGLLFSFLGRTVVNRCRVRMTRGLDVDVFWGLGERELMLARSLWKGKSKSRIQFNLPLEKSYDSAARARLTDLADELHAWWSFVDFGIPSPRSHIGKRHFFLSDDGELNLLLAKHVVDSFCEDQDADDEKVLVVRAGDVDRPEVLATWAESVYERTEHLVRPIVLHEPEMIARKFATDFPLLGSPSATGAVDPQTAKVVRPFGRTLLLGFDHTGRALLNALLGGCRYVGPGLNDVIVCPTTIVDMRADRWQRFCLNEPEIGEHWAEYGLDFRCCQVGTEMFEAWLRPRINEYDRFVFSFPNDSDNIREALRIRALLIESGRLTGGRSVEIFVRTSSPVMRNMIADVHYETCPILAFGALDEIYSEDFLSDDPIDQIARVLNWQWAVNRADYLDENQTALVYARRRTRSQMKVLMDDVNRHWENAPYRNRLSSRASAIGILSSLRLLGIRWMVSRHGLPKNATKVVRLEARLRKGTVDVLARLEHLRWWAYVATNGIRSWNLLEPVSLDLVCAEVLTHHMKGEIIPNSLANQISRFRRHAAMVPFDELPGVDVALARACGCSGLSPEEFIGRGQPDIGGGRHPSSLQGKDYDVWQIVPDALRLAGIVLYEETKAANDVCARSRGIRGVRVRHLFRRLARRCRKIRDVFCRKANVPAGIADYKGDLSRIREYASWISNAYDDHATLPPGAISHSEFLKSGLVRRPRLDTKGYTVFWFDDAITLWRKSLNHRTRLPYCFDHANGMVVPLYRLDKRIRRRIEGELGMKARRILFQRNWVDKITFRRQPDFVAQVFSLSDKVVVVFRGTATIMDWCEDVVQCLGFIPPQFRLAADLVRAVCECTSKDVLLLGHSEGGGEVQYALMKNTAERWTGGRKIEGVTINSQRLSPRLLEELTLGFTDRYAREHIENFRMGPDIVSGWAALGVDLLGSVYDLNKKPGWSVRSHLCSSFLSELDKLLGRTSVN